MCVCVLFNLKRPAIDAMLRASSRSNNKQGLAKPSHESSLPRYATKSDRYANLVADILIKSFFFSSAVMGSRWELAMLATYPIWDGIFMEKTVRGDIKSASSAHDGKDSTGSCCGGPTKDAASATNDICSIPKKQPHPAGDSRIVFGNEFLKTHSGYLYASQITSTLMAAAYVTLFGAATASVSVLGVSVPALVLPLTLNLLADAYHFYNYSNDADKLVQKFNADEDVSASSLYNVNVSECCRV